MLTCALDWQAINNYIIQTLIGGAISLFLWWITKRQSTESNIRFSEVRELIGAHKHEALERVKARDAQIQALTDSIKEQLTNVYDELGKNHAATTSCLFSIKGSLGTMVSRDVFDRHVETTDARFYKHYHTNSGRDGDVALKE